MKRKNEIFRKKIIGAIVVFIVVFSFFGLVFGRKNTPFEQVIKETFQSIEYYCIKRPIQFVNDLREECVQMHQVYEENKKLRSALDDYAIVSSQNEALKKENNDLKEAAGLQSIPTDYKEKVATVISRDVESWNNKLVINMGSQSGITEGMVALGNNGMVGKVTSVSVLTSTVTLLTSENTSTQVPIMVKKKGTDNDYAYGMLRSYDVESKCFVVDMLESCEIEIGESILTSGLGGNSPRGIIVGYVQNSTILEDQVLPQLSVEPASHFDDLNYVTILQRSDVSE